MPETRPVETVTRASVVIPAEEIAAHAAVLLALARSIVRVDAEAEEIVQATFEIALRRLGTLRDPGALRAWLCTILVREAFRATRRLRRLVRLDGRWSEPAPAARDAAGDIDARQALRSLPDRTRAAVVLHHMIGLSVRETAAAMGVSENTVKTLLRLGLARLREELDDA